jgi:hypothetical protein
MKTGERRAPDNARATVAGNLAAYAFGADGADMMCATRRAADAAFVRQVAMYLTHVAFEMSLSRVAYAFERDRSTVAHACRVIEDKREDSDFDARVGALEEALRFAPAPLLAARQSAALRAPVRDALRVR